MTRVAINGFGRIGRLVARGLLGGDHGPARAASLDLVMINDPHCPAATAAHLLEFDSVHGRMLADIGAAATSMTVNGSRIAITDAATPEACDWAAAGVDLVIEASGRFKDRASLDGHIAAGAHAVLVAAPVKAGALNLVVGVNDHLLADWMAQGPAPVVTAASCTTNCLAPVVKVLHEAIGIRHGSITTVHDVTNTQTLIDAPHKDLRRARSALTSLIPTSTGSATAIGLIFPDLQGRLDGIAVRVPLLNASLTDAVFEMTRETSVAEVNDLFAAAAAGPLAGILGFEMRPLVSVDYRGDTRSAIVDGLSTRVIAGTQVKIYAWYDNEMGYATRMIDLAARMAGHMQVSAT